MGEILASDAKKIEEKEILSGLKQECINYFKNYMNDTFTSKLKDIIIKDTEVILKMLKYNLDNPIDNDDIRNRIIKEINEINEMNFFNAILIGNIGVGKSTLINGFLHLKNNTAKGGDTAEPQKIGKWPKKYPVNKNDTDIIGINLFDTEGIEKTGENSLKQHLDKIADFIYSPQINLNERINVIWYCLNNNELDDDDKYYINSIFELFTGLKIPIIFIFTQAYRSRKKDIKKVKEEFEKIEYFKENPNELHFVEVITKDLINVDTGDVLEAQKGLDKLFEETVNVSDQTINAQFMKIISEVYNQNYMKIIEKLSNKLEEQYDDIAIKQHKLKTFNKKFYDIFETVYGKLYNEKKNFVNQKISGWMKIIEEIQKSELKTAMENYDKKYIMYINEQFIKEKYEEKKKEVLSKGQKFNQDYKKFKGNINKNLIPEINNFKENYGLFSLFDLVRDLIKEMIYKQLENDLNREKMESHKEIRNTIISQKIEELKNKIMNKK